MMTKFVQTIFSYRNKLKWLIPIRRPIRLQLKDFKMYICLDDWAVGARIAIKRNYEPHVTEVMSDYLKLGMTVLDIGANIGYYTLLAAAKVGSIGKVISFEPSNQNCDLLQKSLDANNFTQVSLYPYAVANENGSIWFRMDDSNGAVSTTQSEGTYEVQKICLDEFLQDEPRIDVVKIDIEGAEGLALSGMLGLLAKHQPVIFSEFNPRSLPRVSGMSGETYLNTLQGLGYELYVLEKQGQHPTPQTTAEILAYFKSGIHHIDLVGYPKSAAT